MDDKATLAELRRQAGKLRRRAERLEELAERLGKPAETHRAVKAQRAEVREQARAEQRRAVPLPLDGCGCPRCQAAADELAQTPARVLCQFAVYALDPARDAWSRSMVLQHFRRDFQRLAAALPPEPLIWRFMDDLRRARRGGSHG